MNVQRVSCFVPDHSAECAACGNSPTVTPIVEGEAIAVINLCGPCYFGEAAMTDPNHWNKS
jgi:hypothetical protein